MDDDLLVAEPTAGTVMLNVEHPFDGKGGAVDWAESITAVLAVTILVVVLITVVLEWRRSRSPLLGFLRLLGLGALPLFLLPVGNFATFEGSKRVEFCQSCHSAMDPYVGDMQDPESHTLAAVHYKNRDIRAEQCFACHADYGIFGAAKAKANGLNHMYYWITNAATARGEEQIHHYGAYRNELCLTCHAGSQKFLAAKNGVHRDNAPDMARKDPVTGAPVVSCLACHRPAHRTLAQWKARQAGDRGGGDGGDE